MRSLPCALCASFLLAASASARFAIYADEWHPDRPTDPADRANVDIFILAFAQANQTASFQPKVPISTIRSEFPGAKVMIAIGGWGDTIGFSDAVAADTGISQFSNDVKTMLDTTGADGIDIDWEYPGGNGADYKEVPNSAKVGEIPAFPRLLQSLRSTLGDKMISVAVPGKKVDMIAYTSDSGPSIWESVDMINVMAYDLMNRRDNVTAHHTSVQGSKEAVQNYLDIGAPPEKINLGFAFYAKYFTTAGDCTAQPLGCPIVPAEDPVTGADTLKSGAWTFETAHMAPIDTSKLTTSMDGTCGPDKMTKCASACCSQYGNCGTTPQHCSGACQHAFGVGCTDSDVYGSWQTASKNGVLDTQQGGEYAYDPQNSLFWTWDTPETMTEKFTQIVDEFKLGGAMAWSLGEDSYDWSHLRLVASEAKKRDGQAGAPASPSSIVSSAPADAPTSTDMSMTSSMDASTMSVPESSAPSSTAAFDDGMWTPPSTEGPTSAITMPTDIPGVDRFPVDPATSAIPDFDVVLNSGTPLSDSDGETDAAQLEDTDESPSLAEAAPALAATAPAPSLDPTAAASDSDSDDAPQLVDNDGFPSLADAALALAPTAPAPSLDPTAAAVAAASDSDSDAPQLVDNDGFPSLADAAPAPSAADPTPPLDPTAVESDVEVVPTDVDVSEPEDVDADAGAVDEGAVDAAAASSMPTMDGSAIGEDSGSGLDDAPADDADAALVENGDVAPTAGQ